VTGLPIDREKALEIVILYLTTYQNKEGANSFSRWLSQYYFEHPNLPSVQDMFVPDHVWDMLGDTAQRIVNELALIRNGLSDAATQE
jgi:hypothetical protein